MSFLSNRKIKLFLSFAIAFLSLFIINTSALGSFYEERFLEINQAFFEPILFWTTSLLLSSFILVFFSNNIFEFWLKKFLVWYLPLGLFLTFMADTSVSYTFPNKVGLAIWFGSILIFATLVIVLIQKFYFKR